MTLRETHSRGMNELHKFAYILCACAIFIFIYWFIITIICWESYKKNSRKKISSKQKKSFYDGNSTYRISTKKKNTDRYN